VISEAEMLDFWMNGPLPTETVWKHLVENAPPGLDIQEVTSVSLQERALQEQMSASEYQITFYDPQPEREIESKVAALLAAAELPRARRKKTYDLRPLILELKTTSAEDGEIGLWMRLNAEPGATGRPDEVMDELGFTNTQYLACRTGLILKA
jgi:radical SAM-linked protein